MHMKFLVKVIIIILIIIVAALIICYISGCRIHQVDKDASIVVLHFVSDDTTKEIPLELSTTEAKKIIAIFNWEISFPESYSCPFMENISIEIGRRKYLIPLDDCCSFNISGTKTFIKISKEEKEYIKGIFLENGAVLP